MVILLIWKQNSCSNSIFNPCSALMLLINRTRYKNLKKGFNLIITDVKSTAPISSLSRCLKITHKKISTVTI